MSGIAMGAAGSMIDEGDVIDIPATGAFDTDPFGVSATATWTLNSNGTSAQTGNLSPPDWSDPAPPNGSYEVRATLTAGTNPSSGTMSTWLALSSNRSWTNTQSGVGIKTSTITFEIRPTGGSIIDTQTGVVITATVESGGGP